MCVSDKRTAKQNPANGTIEGTNERTANHPTNRPTDRPNGMNESTRKHQKSERAHPNGISVLQVATVKN